MQAQKKRINLLLAIASMSILTGCSDIFEKNIDSKKVNLLAPADGLHTHMQTLNFWWDYVDGASWYNLQIVEPSFDRVERLVLDTNLTINKFQYSLFPGSYQWRVSAFNSGYSTIYTTFTLIVDSVIDLSQQEIILISPSENLATAQTIVHFHWIKIYSAKSYQFEIRKGNWSGSLVRDPINTLYDTLSFNLVEGTYAWGVMAINDNSSSPFSTSTFIIDLTPPLKPVLTSPASGDSLTSTPILLSWERPDTAGSAIKDSLYISSDSVQFFSFIKASYFLNETSYSVTLSDYGLYYWRVRSIDAAGNKSDYSDIRKFIYAKQKRK